MKPEVIFKKKSGQSSNDDPNKIIRDKRFEMRMSSEEFAKFEQKFQESKCNSMASFARDILTSNQKSGEEPSGYLAQALILEVRKLTLALNKVGVNVNQIARILNTKKDQTLSTSMLEELAKYHQELKPLQAVSSTLMKVTSLIFKSKK